MAAASVTFVRGNQIFVRADNVPSGAFLMDSQGNKSTDDSGSQRLTLANVQKNNDLYKNGNDMAYGETFLFCIPKATAEQMDASQEHIQTKIFISMNVDRYNVYAASTTSSGVQPVIMVEPAVRKMSVNVGFNPETFIEYTLLKILKTDESGAPLAGCTFQISYQQDGTPKTQEQTTDGNGEAKFMDLPLNTDVTIKETAAPEGYTLLPDKVVNTGSTGGKTVEVKLSNSDGHVFKVHKTSSADGRNLMGAKFEVKGIDNDFVNSYTTDALGEFTIQGRDLPTGSFEVYEIAAPEGYATDGADIQTFSWDNTRDVTLTFKNAPLPGIQIYKYDKDSKEPLAGATFEIRRDGQVLQTVKIDVNGYAKVYNLPKGFYQVVEVDGDKEHYNLYAPEQTVELIRDQAEIPTLIFQNTIKKHFGIYKIDEEMHKPIQGVTFEIWKDGKLLGNYTADSSGLATVTGLEDGVYIGTEVSCPEGYRLDPEPQNVIAKAGELAIVTFENEKLAGVRIKKIDAVTGEGIYGVRFLIKDEHNNLIGEYSTDQDGYIELDDLLTDGKSEIKIKVEEIAAAEGYVLDDTVRTLRIRRGETTELVVENTPDPWSDSGGQEIRAGQPRDKPAEGQLARRRGV